MLQKCATEEIDWVFISEDYPDEDITVLLFVPDASEPVWFGFCEDGEFYWASGSPVKEKVVAFAVVPQGPKKLEAAE